MKTGPKGPRPSSKASQIRPLLLQGCTVGEICKKLRVSQMLVKWHRWKLRQHAKVVEELLR
jgi:hypothetical protein